MSKNILDIANRPLNLLKKIDFAFEKVNESKRIITTPYKFSWGQNGSSTYQLAGFPEHYFALTIIKNSYPSQKKFIFLDIGSGLFLIMDTLRDFFERQIKEKELPEDIELIIIGTRGEPNVPEEEHSFSEHCEVYKFGNFKCEYLVSELHNRGLDIVGDVSFIFSSMAFKHFADPIGVLADAYKLLRPAGFMLYDHNNSIKYDIHINKESASTISFGPRETIALFLSYLHIEKDDLLVVGMMRKNPTVIIKKHNNNEPMHIPLSYDDCNEFHFGEHVLASDAEPMIMASKFIHYMKKTVVLKNIRLYIGDTGLFNEFILPSIESQLKTELKEAEDGSINTDSYSNDYNKELIEDFERYNDLTFKPRNLLKYSEKYNVKTTEELIIKLKEELGSVQSCYDNKFSTFKYLGEWCHHYSAQFDDVDMQKSIDIGGNIIEPEQI